MWWSASLSARRSRPIRTQRADRDLARRFAAGDEDAIRDLYDRFAGPVHTVAMAALDDRGLASEAVQLTFLQAWRAAARYDADRSLAAWLYTIARRVAIDLYRRERRHQRVGEPVESDVVTLPPDLDRVWEAWEVRRAVETLPADEREVVRLSHFEGLTHAEIAARTETPVGTVKSRSHRAHRRLATALRHLTNDPPGDAQ